MKIKTTLIITAIAMTLAVPVAAQEAGGSGFVISLKNGSTIRGRTLTRDDTTGKLRLTMTEAGGEARSYAVIAPDDTTEIRSSASDIDSISIHLTSTLLAEPSFTATESPFSENSLHLRSLPPLSLIRIESLSLADERISVVSSGAMTA